MLEEQELEAVGSQLLPKNPRKKLVFMIRMIRNYS